MPQRSARPCRIGGCPGVVRYGMADCTAGHAQQVRGDDPRASAASRGYGARWRRLRVMFLREHPLCVDPYNLHSGPVAATDVDHIVARRDGGSDKFSNLQPLCHSCHSIKTNEERAREGGRASLQPGDKRPAGGLSSRGREIENAFLEAERL